MYAYAAFFLFLLDTFVPKASVCVGGGGKVVWQ